MVRLQDVRSYESRRDERKQAAIDAIRRNDWWAAVTALCEAQAHDAVIEELEHQIEVQEVEND